MARYILGIETSCDETAAAVYSAQHGVLSNEIFSQIKLHASYGGVVPEIASRSHLEKINTVVQHALDSTKITLDDIEAIAVTTKPGLPGSLLIGLCFAKAIAACKKIPIIGINHLEGHAFSAMIEHPVPFPHLCLTASGGHTSLYLIQNFGDYQVLGHTIDDAAGEAFDKVAKLMKLPYPGGPIIEKLAADVQYQDFFHYPRGNKQTLNFSFSGIKTAVLYDLVNKGFCDRATKDFNSNAPEAATIQKQVASSLLVCIADVFKNKLQLALELNPSVKAITFVGGVACNKYIRKVLHDYAQQCGLPFYVPSPQFCTDNGAMIAFVGHYKAEQNIISDMSLDIL